MAVNVAVVGATGAVGEEFLLILDERAFPVKELRLLASKNSAGKNISFRGTEYTVQELTKHSFHEIHIALFSAGANVSREYIPYAIGSGAVCVDNSSAFRMDDDVPLVVPEVNPQEIARHHGLIANPNCSTIQMVVALKPIYDAAGIKRIVVSTYQAVSGAGLKAVDELLRETASILAGRSDFARNVFPHQIAFNILPQIPQGNAFLSNGYTTEEMKMIHETKKIMGDDGIRITATTVRVPVVRCHCESVNVETEKKITAQEVRELLTKAPGVTLLDNPAGQEYPLPAYAAGKDDVFVGRIREDDSVENGINMWIVSDNIRKGAALNAIQIAERLLDETASQ
ncbi:MAG: aspartate-semialdehyde dehydrogenase [Candidatus Loosdrechtia sp.]|uniref:aspartate-semialdehyde dehydrogenase n=1 Tax=Candidatus Loosdrechtia sp. TaxID=3101272 RepID=UPI003A652FD1|nr:MAG: aspartate-semialdehyde dehydrogenase [Candidatus Jettenia sp. AMX2]